jgi:signal peptidase I
MNPASLFYIGLAVIGTISLRIGLYRLFEKAGEKGWKAFIPVYSDLIWLKLIGKPVWWLIFTLIPVARTLVKISMEIELAKAFGKYTFGQQALAVIFPFIYFPYLGFKPETQYVGDIAKKEPPKGAVREWADAFLFAGVAALIIRTFFLEAFMIPTSSMERTLLAGDFLFVSKFHYGPRMPMIPLSVPFVHNKIKLGGEAFPSYLNWIQLPYWRAFGLRDIRRNDIVVFNYPAHDVHDLGNGKVKEISMKENYIKRCVAIPGDILEVKRGELYINGAHSDDPENMQYSYMVKTDGSRFSQKRLSQFGFRAPLPEQQNKNYQPINDVRGFYSMYYPNSKVVNMVEGMEQNEFLYAFWMTGDIEKVIRSYPYVKAVDTILYDASEPMVNIFPGDPKNFPFNRDNFGPMEVPQKGKTVTLTASNYKMFERIIGVYEKHDFKVQNGGFYIDGEKADTYTFEMDYFFMMGDNRHNSEDSRFWGFVPENHIVGRPLIVFFSIEKEFGIRWSRMGTKYTH